MPWSIERQDRDRPAIAKMINEAERLQRAARSRRRVLVAIAVALGAIVLSALTYMTFLELAPRKSPLPPIPNPDAISPRDVTVIDGDTIQARGRTIRLVGFDAPESGLLARCARERELAARATGQLKNLVTSGGLELRLVPCACKRGTEGTYACNYGRSCGNLLAYGRDVGATLIEAGVARPYICGATSCPSRGSWC